MNELRAISIGASNMLLNKEPQSSFSQLFEDFAPRIYRFCLLRVNSKEIAQDITSQTFLKTWEYLKGGQEIKSKKPFLYKVAANLISDHWRDKNNLLRRLDDELEVTLIDSKNTPESVYQFSDLKTVINCINRLPEEQKLILQLKYVEDLSIREISEVTGKKTGTIYVSIFRSLKSLKDIFNKNNKSEYV